MKKVLIITLAVFTFVSCKKSNSNTSAPVTIVGKWYLNIDSGTYYSNGVLSGTYNYPFNGTKYYDTFNADGTGMQYTYNYDAPPQGTFKFTYTITKGDTVVFNYPQQVVNGVTYDQTEEFGAIKTLTSDHLVLHFGIGTPGSLYVKTGQVYGK